MLFLIYYVGMLAGILLAVIGAVLTVKRWDKNELIFPILMFVGFAIWFFFAYPASRYVTIFGSFTFLLLPFSVITVVQRIVKKRRDKKDKS